MHDKTEIRRSQRTQVPSFKLSDLVTDTNAYKGDFFKRIALVKSNPVLPSTLFQSGCFLPIGAPLKDSLTPVLHGLATRACQETNQRYRDIINVYSQKHESEQNETNLHQLIQAHYLYAEHLLVLIKFFSNCLIQSQDPQYSNKMTAAHKREYCQHVENFNVELFDQLNAISQLCDVESEEHQTAVNIKETYATIMGDINSQLEGPSSNKKRKNTAYSVAVKFMKPSHAETEEVVGKAEADRQAGIALR